MVPFVAGGELWKVARVDPDDHRLVDRTGWLTVGTTDPATRTIYLSSALKAPELDRVVLHELAHAMTMSHGALPYMRELVPQDSWITVEEWSAAMMENHSLEAVEIASMVLGRPVCIGGFCHDRSS